MNEKLNATCDICGKKYHVCQSCKDIASFTPWRVVTDTLNHYLIFVALSNYTKTKDKRKAQEELSLCDLSDKNEFVPKIQNTLEEIFSIELVNETSEENISSIKDAEPTKNVTTVKNKRSKNTKNNIE